MPIETLEEFRRRHQEFGAPVQVNRMLVFADGALAEPSALPGVPNVLTDPPNDEQARLNIVRQYWQHRAAMAESTFKELKNTLLGQSMNRPQWRPELWGDKPSNDPEQCLLALQKIVATERERLAEVEADYNRLPAIQRQRKREQAAQEARQATEAAERERLQRISSISI